CVVRLLVLLVCAVVFVFFFFSSRRRHTRLVSDWSSDVCSSDLLEDLLAYEASGSSERRADVQEVSNYLAALAYARRELASEKGQIGRASCRERGGMSEGGGGMKERRRRKEVGMKGARARWKRDG